MPTDTNNRSISATGFSQEYRLIKEHYGVSKSNFDVPLIQVVDDGLVLLAAMSAPAAVKGAWCLHPLLQSEEALEQSIRFPLRIRGASPMAILFAMDFRLRIGSYPLQNPVVYTDYRGRLIPEVKMMLIAQKVQGRSAFLRRKDDYLPPSERGEMDLYYRNWLDYLGVSQQQYVELSTLIAGRAKHAFPA